MRLARYHHVDSDYYSAIADNEMLRPGVRRIAQVMETPAAREIIKAETPPKGMPVLTSNSSDEDIDVLTDLAVYLTVARYPRWTIARSRRCSDHRSNLGGGESVRDVLLS